MLDKFTQVYAKLISEMNQTKVHGRKRIVKEQEEEKYDVVLFVQDPDSNENDYDASEPIEDKEWCKTLVNVFGATTDYESHDMGERTGANGGLGCFYFKLNGIAKSDLYNLMIETKTFDGNPDTWFETLVEDALSSEEIQEAFESEDNMIAMLKKAADENSFGVVSIKKC